MSDPIKAISIQLMVDDRWHVLLRRTDPEQVSTYGEPQRDLGAAVDTARELARSLDLPFHVPMQMKVAYIVFYDHGDSWLGEWFESHKAATKAAEDLELKNFKVEPFRGGLR